MKSYTNYIHTKNICLYTINPYNYTVSKSLNQIFYVAFSRASCFLEQMHTNPLNTSRDIFKQTHFINRNQAEIFYILYSPALSH